MLVQVPKWTNIFTALSGGPLTSIWSNIIFQSSKRNFLAVLLWIFIQMLGGKPSYDLLCNYVVFLILAFLGLHLGVLIKCQVIVHSE